MSKKQSADETELAPLPLPNVHQVVGQLDATGLAFGIVASRYNRDLSGQLVSSAVDTLLAHGAVAEDIIVVWVPGAYEVSSALHQLARRGSCDALIGMGVVVQGETPHAGLINRQVAHALAALSREHNVPVLDGVVPAENVEQATVRCRGGEGGRGAYLARAAIEMAHVFRDLGTHS